MFLPPLYLKYYIRNAPICVAVAPKIGISENFFEKNPEKLDIAPKRGYNVVKVEKKRPKAERKEDTK